MIKILILVSISYISTVVYADDTWPTKVAEVGCKFEYKGFYGTPDEVVEIIELPPFPEIRIETNRDINLDPNIKSMSELLAEAAGKRIENLKRGKTKNLFCDCYDFEGLDNLFPLSVGKRTIWKDKITFDNIVEVVKYRKSPYFVNTNEYLISYSIPANFSYFPRFGPKYRLWWNVELGFYTEKEKPLNLTGTKLISSTCEPKNHE